MFEQSPPVHAFAQQAAASSLDFPSTIALPPIRSRRARLHAEKVHMFPFSPPANPVVRSPVDSPFALFNYLSRTLTESFHLACKANLMLGQTMLASMTAGQSMPNPRNAKDVFAASVSEAPPGSEKLPAHEQHCSRLAADDQVELARVGQLHVPELADEVTRIAAEETERSMRQKTEALKNFRDPFEQADAQLGNGDASDDARSQNSGKGSDASMQFDGLVQNGSIAGHVQGPVAQPAQQNRLRVNRPDLPEPAIVIAVRQAHPERVIATTPVVASIDIRAQAHTPLTGAGQRII